MRFLLDTNFLISAALFPDGATAQLFELALGCPIEVVVCDYSLAELEQVVARKSPSKVAPARAFTAALAMAVKVVPTPLEPLAGVPEHLIPDPKDWPILRATVVAQADWLVTGDKDLLNAGLLTPKVITGAQFRELLQATA